MVHRLLKPIVLVTMLVFAFNASTTLGQKPFYEYDLVGSPGFRALNGETLTGARREVSINESGQVVYIARYAQASAVVTIGVDSGLQSLSFKDDEQELTDYQFPVINSDGMVVARRIREDRTQVRLFDSSNPESEVRVVYAPPPPNLVTLPAFGNDGSLGFVRLFDGKTNLTDITGDRLDTIEAEVKGLLRPVAADGRTFVVRLGTENEGSLVRYVHSNGGAYVRKELAKTQGDDWALLGDSPGVSANGKLVAFMGSSTENHPATGDVIPLATGIFLSEPDAATPAAAAPFAVCTKNTIIAFDDAAEPITFSSFDSSNRVGVAHFPDEPAGLEGDRAVVVFMATPSAPSRGNSGNGGKPLLFGAGQGIWTVRVDFEQELKGNKIVPHVSAPLPVAQVGETLFGGTVSNLSLYDPIAPALNEGENTIFSDGDEDHYIAFWALTSRGEYVVRARWVDSDNDGLPDHWETKGIDMDGDGIADLDLKAMGADPFQRDLFLQINWISPRTSGAPRNWSNELAPKVTEEMVKFFEDAPTTSFGIPEGITLHIDAGPSNDKAMKPYSQNMGNGPLFGGEFSEGVRPDLLYFGKPGLVSRPGLKARAVDEVRMGAFERNQRGARELAFRFCLIGDFYDYVTSASGNAAVIRVVAATATKVTTHFSAMERFAGKVALVFSGKGAGQLRRIRRPAGLEDEQFMVNNPWNPVLDATSRIVISGTSGGRAEVGFYDEPDNGSVSGNDMILTLGMWGVNRGGWLANGSLQARVILHEFGHTLGLRHGGTDHCQYKGTKHQSIMSYTHQNRYKPTSSFRVGLGDAPPLCHQKENRLAMFPMGMVNPLFTFSDGTDDVGYNEWDNLRYGFARNLRFLGNTFGKDGLKGAAQDSPLPDSPPLDVPEPDWEDVIEVNGTVDLAPPTVRILSPVVAGAPIGMGSEIVIEATDDVGVATVSVGLDMNGDGLVGDDEEFVAEHDSGNTYLAEIRETPRAVSGSRSLFVEAEDGVMNVGIAELNVRPALLVSGGTFPAQGAGAPRQKNGFGPISVPAGGVVTFVVEGTPGIASSGGQADAGVESISFGGNVIPLQPSCDGSNPSTCTSTWFATGPGTLTGEVSGPIPAQGASSPAQTYNLSVFFDGDVIAPIATLEDPEARYFLGGVPTVAVVATDDRSVASVTVAFDLNGDGDTGDAGEQATSAPGGDGIAHVMLSAPLSGEPGNRNLIVTTRDGSGNLSTLESSARVLRDSAPPELAITFPGSGSAVGVGGTVEVELDAADDRSLESVGVTFDRNGDGDTLDAGESVVAAALGGSRYRAVFGEISGAPGPRQITAVAMDGASNQTNAMTTLSVSAGGTGPQTLLTESGTIPAQNSSFAGGRRQTVALGPVTVPARGLITFMVTSTPPVRREVRNIPRADTTIERVTFNGEQQARLRVTCNDFGADPAICTSSWEAPGAGQLEIDLLGPGAWNTFGEFVGHAAQDYQVEVLFEPIDAAPPVVEFASPAAGAVQTVGQPLTVDLSVRDPSAVAKVTVRFDRNGDGDNADAGESIEATAQGGANFRASFAAVSGNAGARVIETEAEDAFGNKIVAESYVSVGGSIGGGRQTLLIQSGDFPEVGSAFAGGERQTRSFPSVEIPGPGRVFIEVTASPPVRRATQNIPRFDAAVERIRFDGLFIHLTPDCNDFGSDPSVCTTVWDSQRTGLLGGEVLGPATFNVFDEFSGHGAQSYTLKITFAGGPGVASVQPSTGSSGGRTSVTVRGGGFKENAVVLFGNVAATDVVFVNETELRCVTPPGVVGDADVTVINPDPDDRPFNFGGPYGTFGVLERGYRYDLPAPPADPGAERLLTTFAGRFPEKRITELQESTRLPFTIPGAGKLRFEAWAFVPILGAIAGPADDPGNLEVHNDSTAVPWFVGGDGRTFFMDPSCTPLDFAFGPVICESVREHIPASASGLGTIQVRGPAKWSARFKALEVCELLGAPEQSWSIAVWFTPDEVDPGPGGNSFTTWQQDEFTFVEQITPEISGANADPDRDSIPNAVEFIVGGNPKRPDSGEQLVPTIAPSVPFPYPGVEFQVRNTIVDAVARVQVSEDLRRWDDLYVITEDPGFLSPFVVSRTPVGENFTKLVVRDTLPFVLARFPRYFRLAVDLDAGGNGELSGKTELTFDIDGFGDFQNMDQGYGDGVTAAEMGRYSYGGSGAFTPNIQVSYGPDGADPAFWSSGYGDLQGILFEDRDGFGILEVTFTADAGFLVSLERWDMAAYGPGFSSDPTIDAVEVRDGDGNVLHSQRNVTISESTRTRFDFGDEPFEAPVVVLRFESGNLGNLSDDIALDNVLFGQRARP